MDSTQIERMKSQFDEVAQTIPDSDVEFWFARDLMEPLGYSRWENFINAIKRAIESCESNNFEGNYHFRGVTKLITHGKGGQRESEKTLSQNIYERGVDDKTFGKV